MVFGVAAAILPTSVIGGVVSALGPAVIGSVGTTLLTERTRFPRIAPGDILRAALATQALSEQGLVPRISTDPFTGNLVVSTENQTAGLFNLLGERFAREALASTPAESAAIFAEREAFPVSASNVDPPVAEVRENVLMALQRVSPTVIAPGVVSAARPSTMSRRLGGPCAGVTTGFERLNCARGGIS